MRKLTLIFLVGVISLTACNDGKKPSDSNFKVSINQYLAKHGKTCAWIGQPFPVDVNVSEAEQKLQPGIGSEMAALEAAGRFVPPRRSP